MCVHRAEIDDGMLVVCVSPGGLLCVVFFRGPPTAYEPYRDHQRQPARLVVPYTCTFMISTELGTTILIYCTAVRVTRWGWPAPSAIRRFRTFSGFGFRGICNLQL